MLIYLWKRPSSSEEARLIIPDYGCIALVVMPITLPIVLPIYGCVRGIEFAQRKFCPERLDNKADTELEEALGAIEEPFQPPAVSQAANDDEDADEDEEVLESATLLNNNDVKPI